MWSKASIQMLSLCRRVGCFFFLDCLGTDWRLEIESLELLLESKLLYCCCCCCQEGSFGSWLLDEDLEFGWDLGAVWDDDLGDPEELPSGSTDRLLLWKPDSLFKSDHSWRGVAEVTRASRSRLVVVCPGDETREDVDSSWTGWSFACYCSLYKWFRSRLDQFAPVRIKCNRSVRTFCRRLIPPVLFFCAVNADTF